MALGYRSRKEAERACVELLVSLEKGARRAQPAELWELPRRRVATTKKTTVKETTLALYELHVTKYVVPRLGGVPLLKLGPAHLNTFYADSRGS